MEAPIDITYLRQWIGREQDAAEMLTANLVDRFIATLPLPGDPPVAPGLAPRMIHYCLCQPAAAMSELDHDGHPARGDFLPPVPLPRRMWAASEIRFQQDLQVGEQVWRRSRIADVTVKHGKSGVLCFVAVDHEYAQGQLLVISERQTIVYRTAAQGSLEGKRPAPVPAPRGEASAVIAPTPTLLFRYSALTFNSHRIHYDQPYATAAEGYAGLVVHGPLQATILLRLATSAHPTRRAPDRFSFRGVSPLVAPAPMIAHATARTDDAMDLWAANAGGPVAMQAEARWG